MVKRSILFFNKYGPIIKGGFTFDGGYTDIINSGDGDFLTSDTLWDFKVSKNNLTSVQTLQILIYYIMGIHSMHDEFRSIQKLGIFNPRINCTYLKVITDIPTEIIAEVSTKVIGYENTLPNNYIFQTFVKLKKDDLLSLPDIMKILSCSRYFVLKCYSEKGLPLIKINNKYFIDKYDLIDWLERKRIIEEKQQKFTLIVSIISTIVIVILLLIAFL